MSSPTRNGYRPRHAGQPRHSGRRRTWLRFSRTVVTVLVLTAAVATAVVATASVVAVATLAVSSLRTAGPRPGNPFSHVRLFVDPHSSAATARASLVRSDPAAAEMLARIASQPAGIWLGSWLPSIQVASVVRTVLEESATSDSMPLLVLYAYPYRGCEQATAAATAGYERWIGQVAAGIGTGRAAVILEPDALAQYIRLGCLSAPRQAARVAVIRQAVDQLARLPNVALYLDAGNSGWLPAPAMASLLLDAGVRMARGFSLNVSNFYPTAEEEAYGDRIGALLHGAHYVIDTSRNGAATAKTWCNPPGQALGTVPTVNTGRPLADALLWVKPPGVSDGLCNGGPRAGVFWPAYALALAANAHWEPASARG